MVLQPLTIPTPVFPAVNSPLPSLPVVTRFRLDAWRDALQRLGFYRDPDSLLTQIRDGVRLGYTGPRTGYHFQSNHPSSSQPLAMSAIDKEIVDELAQGRMAGPFTQDHIRTIFPFFRTSMLAAVPKPPSLIELRIIDDLTNAGVEGVNAFISDEDAHVRYAEFERALDIVRKLGRGCWLAKIDWRAAFRQIGVCMDDWPLLGMQWRGWVFVRLVLPFGARSSPKLFTQFAAAFAGILRRSGAKHVMFYLDDFLLAGHTEAECAEAVHIMERVAAELGVELHPTKRDGPAQVIVFLGYGIDTINMRIFLPATKKEKVRLACEEALHDKHMSLHGLQSLVGLLLHAARVVQPGMLMARRLLEELRHFMHKQKRDPSYRRHHLCDDTMDDIRWWRDAVTASHWDSTTFIAPKREWESPIVIHADAASTDGAGAVLFDLTKSEQSPSAVQAWCYYRWPSMESPESACRSWPIAALEMTAIAIALATMGPRLAGHRIRIHSDSSNAVNVLRRTSTTSSIHMRLLRGIHALAHQFGFHIEITSHISGVRNVFADAASRLMTHVQDPHRLNELGLTMIRRIDPVIPEWLGCLMTRRSC